MNREQSDETPKTRILIVEDQTTVALIMVYLLSRAGCDVEVATTGAKAMQMAQTNRFDLITLDVDLPGISGFEVCSRLKHDPRLCDTPVVFVSGRPCERDVKHGFELGAADYIAKPFNTLEFAPRLLSHIKLARESNVFDEGADTDAESFCNATQGNQ